MTHDPLAPFIEAASDAYGVTRAELTSRCRRRPLAQARHLSVLLARTVRTPGARGPFRPLPFAEIGAALDVRDHTTAMHGFGAAMALLTTLGGGPLETRFREATARSFAALERRGYVPPRDRRGWRLPDAPVFPLSLTGTGPEWPPAPFRVETMPVRNEHVPPPC